MNSVRKYTIYADFITLADKSAKEGDLISYDTKIRKSDGTLGNVPESDYYIRFPLKKSMRNIDYSNVDIQENVESIERQNFNPYFIEIGFFQGIKRNKVSLGEQLTSAHINFIRDRRPDINTKFSSGNTFSVGGLDVSADERIRIWFDELGRNEFPWNKGGDRETVLNDLDLVLINNENIVSKASLYPIDINN